ncbi:XdhC/CoxI family protein [Rhizobium sp. BK251]|uniref:XdhC family protein n=1 Tax=Rhizobium sp. BK251 TaxID=2512125 RepID=UPI00104EA610|nr:XdhC/CoxI family protein [Rhizobium sp. BK251]TCL68357.1 xanthine dehydrogenase accessory factor [Rhizobium sp. BK251]
MNAHVDVLELVSQLKSSEEAFVLATVVRTVSVTAAKAGAKAVIKPDGTMIAGWIGGGCARGAVLRAAQEALADGASRLVSVQPEDLLTNLGVKTGESRDGVRFVRNMCPSQGTMDIFVEPVLPRPTILVLGASPVAVALAEQAPQMGFHVTIAAPAKDFAEPPVADAVLDGFPTGETAKAYRFVVVATQGRGDEAALKSALSIRADYRGFVGSYRKMAALREKFLTAGIAAEDFDRVKGPAGIDLGAITPEEIALSIIAEIVQLRRRGQRGEAAHQK